MESLISDYYVVRRQLDRMFLKPNQTWNPELGDARRFVGDEHTVKQSVESALSSLLKNLTRERNDYEIVKVEAKFSLIPLSPPPETSTASEREVRTPWGRRTL